MSTDGRWIWPGNEHFTFRTFSFSLAACPPTFTGIESLSPWEAGSRKGIHAQHLVDLTECNQPQSMLQIPIVNKHKNMYIMLVCLYVPYYPYYRCHPDKGAHIV